MDDTSSDEECTPIVELFKKKNEIHHDWNPEPDPYEPDGVFFFIDSK